MIAAIRAEDANHPIIFGDTSWYSLDNLSARTPFPETDRVIYAFHFYEPYIFTHQGADWAKMATTHDVPYPYDPARWSEYSSKLGFNASMPSWILSLTQSYYQMGNAATLYNRLAKVKKWAVKNDVPVICNEFGAYDATSRLEDRERYYSDLVGAFDELEIPWQLWFMILDANTGEVDSAYSKALGL
jgi:licheninase